MINGILHKYQNSHNDNSYFFSDKKLIPSIKNNLINIVKSKMQNFKIDFSLVKNIFLIGDLVDYNYSNKSNIEIIVDLNLSKLAEKGKLELLSKLSKSVSDMMLDKKIVIKYSYDCDVCLYDNLYSLIEDKWIKFNSVNIENPKLIQSILVERFNEFDYLKKKNANIDEFVTFRNSLIENFDYYSLNSIIKRVGNLTDYKKYFSILKKIGFIFEVEDEISNILNDKYFS